MRYAFWISTALVAYTYLGYPAIMWLRSRFAPRPWAREDIQPSISIIVAVHNGLELIRSQLSRLLTIDYPAECTEIVIVCDGCTDGTAEFLASFTHPRVHTFFLEEHSGKAVALNVGIHHARHDILVFVDARPTLEPHAIRELVKNFADPQVGCVGGELYLAGNGSNAGADGIGGMYWRYEKWLRLCEARCDRMVGVSGCFYGVRRLLAMTFPPGTILDDMYQPLSVVRRGSRIVIDTCARVQDSYAGTPTLEFQRKVRTLAGNFQLIRLAPWVLHYRNHGFELLSHKLLRLAVPYLLAIIMISSAALATSPTFALFSVLQIAGYALGVVGIADKAGALRRLASSPATFCLLNAAAIVGLYRFLFTTGPLWKIWGAPPAPRGARATSSACASQLDRS